MKSKRFPFFAVSRAAQLTAVAFSMLGSSLWAGSLTWDGSDTGNAAADGGAGTWDTNTTANWWNGSADVVWPALGGTDDDAVFANSAGTVTVSTVTANDLTFSTTGYILTGSTLTLNGTTPTITTDPGVAASISSVVAGSVGLTKAGTGTLTLNNAQSNTYTGNTLVNAGTLVEKTSSTGGWTRSSASTTISNGGTLKLDFSSQTGPLQANNVKTIAVNSGGTLELTSTIQNVDGSYLAAGSTVTGAGTISKTGVGVVELLATSSFAFSGQLNIVTGAFANNGITWSGNPSVDIASGAFLDLRTGTIAIDKLTGTGTVGSDYITATTLSVGNNSGSSTFDGVIRNTLNSFPLFGGSNNSGTVALTKNGSGTFTLTGANTYTGTTTVSAGTLQIGNAGTSGTLGAGAVTNNAILAFNRTDSLTAGNAISGSGALQQNGVGGTTILTGANNYSGTTTITAGTLQIGNAGTVGTLGTGAVTNNSILAFNRTDSMTVANAISGGGALQQNGAGTLILSGAGTYTGVTAVNAGTLNVSGTLTSSITVNSGGTLRGTGSTTGSLALSSGSAIFGAAGTAAGDNGTAFTVVNVDSSAGSVTVLGTLSASNTLDLVRYTGTWTGNAANFNTSAFRSGTVTSVAAASGNKLQFATSKLTDTWIAASGTWDNSHAAGLWTNGTDNAYYSGDDVVFSDVSGQPTATVTIGTLVTPGSVLLNNTTSTAYTLGGAGSITGLASLTKSGNGTVTLTGANTYSGGTTLSAGQMNINNASAIGSGALTISGGVIDNTTAAAITLSTNNAQNWNGDFTFTGTKDLSLGTGAVALNASRQVTVSAGTLTVGGTISGTGFSLTKAGAGKLILSGNSTGYNGAVNINSGTLQVDSANGLTSANNVTLGQSGSNTPTLTFNVANTTIGSLTVAANVTGAQWNPNVVFGIISGVTTLNSPLNVSAGAALFSGKITGNGGGAGNDTLIIKGGGGFWEPDTTVANDFSGNVHLTTGQVKLQVFGAPGSNVTIPDASLLIIDSVASLSMNNLAANLVETIDGLSGGGTINQSNGLGKNLTLTINANNSANDALRTFSGSLGNLGSSIVTFGGIGTQGFSGANLNYTNATNINNGTLKLTDTTAWNSAITLGASNTPKVQLNNSAAGTWTLSNVISGGSAAATVEKTGAGTVSLTGANTYTGATTVAAGTLAVNGSALPNAGKLVITGGKVAPTGTEVVDTLYFGAVQQASGTWGSSTAVPTPAHIDDTHFSGTGVVSVTTGAAGGYTTWAATNAPTGTPSDDYDGDGVGNGVEFVLGGLASTNDLTKLPAPTIVGSNLLFTFVRDDAAAASPGTTVQIEVGTTLAAWPDVYTVGVDTASSTAGVTVTDNGTTDTVTLTIPRAPDAAKFARLKVKVAP
ncbi:MAG: autotransporter-associated beta strand repeat-containing protein [Luteolibacter sp.]